MADVGPEHTGVGWTAMHQAINTCSWAEASRLLRRMRSADELGFVAPPGHKLAGATALHIAAFRNDASARTVVVTEFLEAPF